MRRFLLAGLIAGLAGCNQMNHPGPEAAGNAPSGGAASGTAQSPATGNDSAAQPAPMVGRSGEATGGNPAANDSGTGSNTSSNTSGQVVTARKPVTTDSGPANPDQPPTTTDKNPGFTTAEAENAASQANQRATTATQDAAADRATLPDNTAVNKRDRAATAKTPIDQKEDQTDVSLTAKIRSRIENTKEMSVNARNVKIITADGRVTLRGPVNSVTERDTIVRIAREVAGGGNVDDELEVEPVSR
jgi:osmotically-inducible protein OsmY